MNERNFVWLFQNIETAQFATQNSGRKAAQPTTHRGVDHGVWGSATAGKSRVCITLHRVKTKVRRKTDEILENS